MALGPVIGGTFIGIWGEITGVRLAFIFALVMAAVALVMQQRLIEDDRRHGGAETAPAAEKNPCGCGGSCRRRSNVFS